MSQNIGVEAAQKANYLRVRKSIRRYKGRPHTSEPEESPKTKNIWRQRRMIKHTPLSSKIIRSVCKKHNLSQKYVLGKDRNKDATECRAEIYARLRYKTNLSFPQIARIFKRDHSTIVHAFERYEKMRKNSCCEWVES